MLTPRAGAHLALLLISFTGIAQATEPADAEGLRFSLSFEIEPAADRNGMPLPVAVQGRMMPGNIGEWIVDRFSVEAPGSRIAARGRILNNGPRPRLELDLDSPELDLRPLFVANRVDSEPAPRIFSTTPLPAWLLDLGDAEINATLQQVRIPGAIIEDLHLPLRLRHGRLSMRDATGRLAEGKLSVAGDLTAAGDGLWLRGQVSVSGLQPEWLPHAADEPWIQGARTDIELSGGGRGRSIAGIMARADGRLLIRTGKGQLPDAYVDLFGANLFWNVLRSLNPLNIPRDESELECAVIHFVARDGIAVSDRGVVVQTGAMSLVGSGEVDLASETLALGFRPETRHPGDINLAALTRLARVEGTLADPRVEVLPAGALAQGISSTTSVATTGLSLLTRRLFHLGKPVSAPCATALGTPPSH